MTTLAENIRSHEQFERDRGIYQMYSIALLFDRVNHEWEEAKDELAVGDLEKLLHEVLDVWNMIGSLVLHIIDEVGVAPEQVDTIMGLINKSRDAKYAVEYFRSMPPDEAIKVSRDTWEMRRNGHY